MNPIVKIAFYIVLIASGIVFGQRFFAIYSRMMENAARRYSQSETTRPPRETASRPTVVVASSTRTAMGLHAAATLGVVVVFALLFAHDLAGYFGHRATQALYNDEGEGMANPEYEQAEQVWADGDPLEAVRLMREYLRKNPREQHVALRIAEIYEKDLNNPLAAALEYEEVLTKKLPPENWAWSAIHLCNLYYRLNKPEKATALLHRIDEEYPETAAAEKARKRLALQEESPSGVITEEPGSSSESETA